MRNPLVGGPKIFPGFFRDFRVLNHHLLLSTRVLRHEKSVLSQDKTRSQSLPPRISYEYPPPPKINKKPRQSSAWKKHMPLFIGVSSLLWVAYALNYLFGNDEKNQTLLSPSKFAVFKLTHREEITPDLILIELAPKYVRQLEVIKKKGSLWNGHRIWSVEIKHPDIQIVRKYTPLPLYYMQSGDRTPLLRTLGDAHDEGHMVFIVKKYKDGEMSNYLHSLPVGSDVEVRGPCIQARIPYTKAEMTDLREPMLDVPNRMSAEKDWPADVPLPKNICFFTAGTGIAPALQVLLSRNPPRGFTTIYHSTRTEAEVPLERFQLFLEKAGRAKFNIFVDGKNKMRLENIPSPQNPDESFYSTPALRQNSDGDVKELPFPPRLKYTSVIQQFADKNRPWPYAPGNSLAFVCGPLGYLTYVSGEPGEGNKKPVKGLLGGRGWTIDNVIRLYEF